MKLWREAYERGEPWAIAAWKVWTSAPIWLALCGCSASTCGKSRSSLTCTNIASTIQRTQLAKAEQQVKDRTIELWTPARMGQELEIMRAENERLPAALQSIANYQPPGAELPVEAQAFEKRRL